jgi:dienelactone hydrolase
VIINHGKESGDTKFQRRYRPVRAARYFLQRGYVVVVPMRQGFSKSGGYYIGGGCNVASNGRAQAQDVAETLRYMNEQPYVDAGRVLIVGQSHGGWTTLAYGASSPPPGVRGLVNFAGGLRQDACSGWEQSLIRATADLAADVRIPSLWFYGDNDSYFAPTVWQAMHKAYTGAGAPARLVAFGTFDRDAHSLFSSRAGEAVWQPEMTRFLQSLGLPSDVVYPQFGELSATP